MYSKKLGVAQTAHTSEKQAPALSDAAVSGAAESIDGYNYGMPLFCLNINNICRW